MVKRIKNWDKIDRTNIGNGGSLYQIIIDDIRETNTQSQYGFGIWDLTQFVIKGELVITQATQTDLTTGKKTKVDEYTLKLRTHNSTNLVMQHIVMEEIIMKLDLFKVYLSQMCQQMLNKIEAAERWKKTNGYTT
jgi:hypothetical protein